jgi:hypothetical protein
VGGTNTGSSTGTNRTSQLESNSLWLDLKQLWQKLDAILPTTATYSPYANTITTEQRDQYLADLNAALSGIQAAGLLSELELLFLRNIVTARIEVMRDGGYRYELYLHRAPTPFENSTEKSVVLLEQKIDTLELLRDRCVLEPVAYRQALEQIEREATVFFVVDQLAQVPTGYNVNVAIPSDLWGEALATELDKRLAAQAISPDVSEAQVTNLELLRSRLTDIKSTIAGLPLLLQALERCE